MTKNRRIAFFALGICGGLVAGTGALLEWQAVNIGGVSKIKGTDTVFGIIALILAVAVIILTLATRKGSSEEPRAWTPPTILALGAVITAIGAIAATGASFIYDPQRRSDAEKIAKATGASVDEILRTLERVTATRQGSGPWVVLTGGLLAIGAYLAGRAWLKSWRTGEATADETGSEGPNVEGPSVPG